MPVRSLNSSVIKWPDKQTVIKALKKWVKKEAEKRPELERLGYFGSYARGDWGVGSDLDLIAIVEAISLPFERRSIDWDLHNLPVPTDILVYTKDELKNFLKQERAFTKIIEKEVVWIYSRTRKSKT